MANFLNELNKGQFYNIVRLRNLIRNVDTKEEDKKDEKKNEVLNN